MSKASINESKRREKFLVCRLKGMTQEASAIEAGYSARRAKQDAWKIERSKEYQKLLNDSTIYQAMAKEIQDALRNNRMNLTQIIRYLEKADKYDVNFMSDLSLNIVNAYTSLAKENAELKGEEYDEVADKERLLDKVFKHGSWVASSLTIRLD